MWVSMDMPDLFEPQVRLIEAVYGGHREGGRWLTTDFVEALLDDDNDLDLDAILEDMGFGVVTAIAGYGEDSPAQVSAAGLRYVGACNRREQR
jgi:hypothetical protein